jgi:hypothetical protein
MGGQVRLFVWPGPNDSYSLAKVRPANSRFDVKRKGLSFLGKVTLNDRQGMQMSSTIKLSRASNVDGEALQQGRSIASGR